MVEAFSVEIPHKTSQKTEWDSSVTDGRLTEIRTSLVQAEFEVVLYTPFGRDEVPTGSLAVIRKMYANFARGGTNRRFGS
jgi:hypothetical protein